MWYGMVSVLTDIYSLRLNMLTMMCGNLKTDVITKLHYIFTQILDIDK